jgi:hypothetical protein
MQEFKATTAPGSSWTRCARMVLENPRDLPAAMTFVEDRIVNLEGGSELSIAAGNITISLDGIMSESFDLIDPATGVKIGSMTYDQAYRAFYSAYIAAGIKREQEKAAAEVAAPNAVSD